ncbi:hypothetical protein, partial [Marinobacter mobilis]|uniref:hypothetical protein n=1 Tax=Marinobacter mobilis TaxID=488533 RepID=UPI0035C700FF
QKTQYFQSVIFRFLARLSGLPLERDAHSTDLSEAVNAPSEINSKYFGFHLDDREKRSKSNRF